MKQSLFKLLFISSVLIFAGNVYAAPFTNGDFELPPSGCPDGVCSLSVGSTYVRMDCTFIRDRAYYHILLDTEKRVSKP